MNDPKIEFCNVKIAGSQHMSKVFHNLQKKLRAAKELPKFTMEAYKTNVLVWGLFVSSSMKAAIHLGPSNTDNLEVHKNAKFEEIQNLFDITQKLVSENQEMLNVNPIRSESFS